MTLPRGAHAILELRQQGQRPELPVIVSLVGWRNTSANPEVMVTEERHDWAFMAGLEAVVFVAPGAQHVQSTLMGLARPAERIHVWDVAAKRGMEIWPVWRGRDEELHALPLHLRRDARFVRWQRLTWAGFACAWWEDA